MRAALPGECMLHPWKRAAGFAWSAGSMTLRRGRATSGWMAARPRCPWHRSPVPQDRAQIRRCRLQGSPARPLRQPRLLLRRILTGRCLLPRQLARPQPLLLQQTLLPRRPEQGRCWAWSALERPLRLSRHPMRPLQRIGRSCPLGTSTARRPRLHQRACQLQRARTESCSLTARLLRIYQLPRRLHVARGRSCQLREALARSQLVPRQAGGRLTLASQHLLPQEQTCMSLPAQKQCLQRLL